MLIINPYRFASTAAFDPASLFQSGTYKGFWIDASDTTKLKQDTGGSTAVTADGDPVGYVAETSGNGGIFTRYTDDTYRPAFKVVNGYNCLRFDGSNDELRGDAVTRAIAGNSIAASTYILAINADSTGSFPKNIFATQGSDGLTTFPSVRSTTTLRFNYRYNGYYKEYTSFTCNEVAVYTLIWLASGAIKIRKNGSQVVSQTDASGAWPSNAGNYTAVGGIKGDIYQVFAIGKELTGTDLTDAEKAIGAKAGITI